MNTESNNKQQKTIQFIKEKDYIIVNEKLGEGSFGKAMLIKDPYIDDLFVAKKYEPQEGVNKTRFYSNFVKEIKLLYKLNHKNIVRIFNYYVSPKQFTGYIIMEFINGERIDKYIKKCSKSSNSEATDNLFSQLIDAFCYLENRGIIHRDIRENNILVENNGTVKIIDFGIGKNVEPGNNKSDSLASMINRNEAATLPKEYYQRQYTILTDMYYLGDLLLRLLNPNNSFSYYTILEKMTKKNPYDRYKTFQEIKETIEDNKFDKLNLTKKEKEVYLNFTDSLYYTIKYFKHERSFILNPEEVISRMEIVIRNNVFEDYIQNNEDLISCLVDSSYTYINDDTIEVEYAKDFLNWLKSCNTETQTLIINNLKTKLSRIKIKEEDSSKEIPF